MDEDELKEVAHECFLVLMKHFYSRPKVFIEVMHSLAMTHLITVITNLCETEKEKMELLDEFYNKVKKILLHVKPELDKQKFMYDVLKKLNEEMNK